MKVNHKCRSGKPLYQGLCGSCYAIATSDTAAIIKALYDGDYKKLSAQEIVSAMKNGCQGGTFSAAFDYMHQRGLHLEWNYPYRNQMSEFANAVFLIQ